MRKILFGLLLLSINLGCIDSHLIALKGNLPINDTLTVDVYHFSSGKLVYSDTLMTGALKLTCDSMPAGLYQMVLSWNRDLLRPKELKYFARAEMLDRPKFSIGGTFWSSSSDAKEYEVVLSKPLNRMELEEELLKNRNDLSLVITSTGENNCLYNAYLEMLRRYQRLNQQERHRLTTKLYAFNDRYALDSAQSVYARLKPAWIRSVKTQLVTEEISFFKKHQDKPVVEYLVYSQINSEEDMDTYRSVFDGLAPATKSAIARKIRKNILKTIQ